ncbi:phenylacetate--CoA ligase family protein [Exiguobacterium acetylicum]|uniref:phenylacetate--CoA ligase family protein n=1 Tax=Exiguobacterium sp. BMC-KP TaxID=1684312 RepID=UPI0006AA5954|nr:phenylacetate--CoA ligase family protein [Exiguobacterium sp. BMC-KP]KOP29404.1 coenzyme F390 synthetase [Exiguobacterium sp. BMC-KP]
MGIKEQIYNRSPLFLQDLFTTLYGYQLHRERYGPVYQERLQTLLKREHMTIDVEADQLDRLNDFLRFCAEHSPYYNHLLISNDITLPLKDLLELKNIPVLSKEILRTRMEEIRTDIPAPIIGKTGGTTGMSLQVRYTVPDMQIRMAHLDYFKATHGVRRGMRRVSFTAQDLVPKRQQTDVYWRMNRASNQLLFTVKRLSPRTMAAYLEAIERFQPETMDGLPSAMIELARFAKREGIRLTCQPIAIFPTAERIETEERQVIEEMFHGPVFDQYASSEGAPIVSECRFGQKHLHHEMGIIELDVDGEILVTSFDTHGTPLIRYRVGDRMTLSQRTCSCGHPGPIIDSIDGRGRAFVQKPDGQKIFEAQLSSLVKHLPNSIERIQYVQETPDSVSIYYVPDAERFNDADEQLLMERLYLLFGREIKLDVRAVSFIDAEESGKILLVKSSLTG